MPFATNTAFAGYTVLRLLGSGGMGEVYLAQHPRLPRQDALKVLRADVSADSDYRERFAREAELAAKLWHPNIVSVHDRGEDEGRLWISMQYVDGTDAGRLLQDHYPSGMPLPAVLEIVTAVASALDHAHARGLLHRDVKPSNILIAELEDDERRILLGDFGVARDLGDSSGLTVTGSTVGTVAYAAPEQLMGLPLDNRADQYALAATAYHLLTGAFLFPSSNPAVVIGQHLTAQPPSLAASRPELAALDVVLGRALAKDAKDRFGSCMEFARALCDATALPPPVTYPTLPQPVAAPVPNRWPTVLAAVAFVVTLCVAAYIVIKVVNRPAAMPQQFALTGTVHLNGDSVTTSGLPAGYRCAGAEELGDVVPDASVTVADEAGKLLAKGSFESSYLARGSCNMSFRIDNVPSGANFYRVKVARQDESSFTESEAKAGVDIPLGSSAPSSSPTAGAAPSSTRPSTTSSVPDPEQQALNRLRAIAADDKPAVIAYLNNRWVPQLSSKYKNLEAEGTVWTYANILEEHLALRQRYPGVKLLWSSDWPVFEPGYWVTIAGIYYDDYRGALAWCTYQGFDRNHCFAKLISTTHGPDGSTQLNP